jgi:hypothetical protein
MSILSQLEKNKGTVSSALGKALAEKALAGEPDILREAVDLLTHPSKVVRSGAAKIVEQVALYSPHMAAPYAPRFLPALKLPEPQTRWMMIHTLGLCAALDTPSALQALPKAKEFITADSGVSVWDRTITYLGWLGATSLENAYLALPLLELAFVLYPKLARVSLESLQKWLAVADSALLERILAHAQSYVGSDVPAIKAAAIKLKKQLISIKAQSV